MTPSTGQRLLRDEDPALLQGLTPFTADINDDRLVGAAHVAFVRSPYAHARIESIDVADVAQHPGFVAVFCAADLGGLASTHLGSAIPEAGRSPLLATDVVQFVGQPVVAVLANTAAQAVDAAESVIVEYQPLTPVLTIDDALEVSAIEQTRFTTGATPAAFEDSDVRVRLRHWNPRQSPVPIEARSVAAHFGGNDLIVWSGTQRPHGFRDALTDILGLEPECIRVVAPGVGGGFGGKVSRTAEEFVVPAAAFLLRRPVRWNETRSEYFLTATQGRGERVDVEIAGGSDGRMTAISVDLVKDGGAFPLVGVVLGEAFGQHHASGCYDIAHVEFSAISVLTHRPPTSAFRGAGRAGVIAAIERTVDRFAHEVGMDPADVRRRNLIRSDQMPYSTSSGAVYDEADYPGDLETAIGRAGYDDLRAEQRKRRQDGSERLLGIGIASYLQMTNGGGGEEAAVRIETDGTATVVTGTTSQGHGHATTWAQIAGDVLGMDPSTITVIEGDTNAIATGVGAVGSRSLQTAGLAVHNSSAAVLNRARSLAADRLEAAEVDIIVGTGGLTVRGTPSILVSWKELAADGLGSERELSCGEYYDAGDRNTFPSGCHIAVVEVDIETGRVWLRRLIGVDDAGVRVNPMIVEGQIHGGMASGAAQALGEEMAYDAEGNPITANFADYAIGSIDLFPLFELGVSETATSMNSLGFKGVGESGTIGATPAVHNAVIDAVSHLGVLHMELPCTPRRVWEALESVRSPDADR